MSQLAYALCTVADQKTYLGVSVSTWDTLLEDLIDSCTEWLQKEMGGRQIKDLGTAITEYHDGDTDGTGKTILWLRQWPLDPAKFTGVYYNSGTPSTPVWTAYNANDYTRDDETGTLYFGFKLPRGRKILKVVYQGGYTTLPDDIVLACKKLVAKEFDKRKSQGLKSESIGNASLSWNEDIDPGVLAVAQKYRRFA